MRLLLASQSRARLATLRAAGIEPIVEISEVDEDELVAGSDADPRAVVAVLAKAKAEDVAGRHRGEPDLLVLGCDSMFELDGTLLGKPGSPDAARNRLRAVRGRTGRLHTGHHLIRTGTGAAVGATASTDVTFGRLTDAEIDAYVATGEPVHVAGAFTIDGLGGPFIERIDGDHHNVVGLSLPLLRQLLDNLDLTVMDVWNRPRE